MRESLRTLVTRIRDYFDQSSVHGLKYITEPNRHPSER
jgi:hypothetical protein